MFLLFLGLRTHRRGGGQGGRELCGRGDASTIRMPENRLWGHCGVGHGVGNFDLLVKARRMMYLRNPLGRTPIQLCCRVLRWELGA